GGVESAAVGGGVAGERDVGEGKRAEGGVNAAAVGVARRAVQDRAVGEGEGALVVDRAARGGGSAVEQGHPADVRLDAAVNQEDAAVVGAINRHDALARTLNVDLGRRI